MSVYLLDFFTAESKEMDGANRVCRKTERSESEQETEQHPGSKGRQEETNSKDAAEERTNCLN